MRVEHPCGLVFEDQEGDDERLNQDRISDFLDSHKCPLEEQASRRYGLIGLGMILLFVAVVSIAGFILL